jgi:hypothetical protein
MEPDPKVALLHLHTSRPPSVDSAAARETRDVPFWLNLPGVQLRIALVVRDCRQCILHEWEWKSSRIPIKKTPIIFSDTTYIELCGLVVKVLGYRSRGPGSITGATRFSEK